jgi:hypothetical protein
MGKASRKKRPVKAKARKGSTMFSVVVVAIVVLGVAGIALSRGSKDKSSSGKGAGPQINDHWHAAIGVNLCGTWQANLPLYESATGLHSHGDGFMHMHPFSAAGAGSNANVGLFYSQAGDKVSATQVKFAKQAYKNGDVCDNLDKKVGEVRWSVNGQEKTGNPASFVPNDRDVVALAFLPKDVPIGTPPVAATNPSDVGK